MEKNYRLFVDMDGTLAEFQKMDTLEKLYEEGYFRNLRPLPAMVEAIQNLQRNHSEMEIFILSSVLSDSPYALHEKNAWLDEHLPGIDKEHRIFPPCGTNKKEYVPGGVRETDFLLDDYTKNLRMWGNLQTAIKVLNGINGIYGTWRGNKVSAFQPAEVIEKKVADIIACGGIKNMNMNFRGGR